MKHLLVILTLACGLLSARAASPTFSSFSTNDFTVVTNLSAPWEITARRTNIVNVYTNATVIYTNVMTINTNSVTINTNVYITNSYLYINGTNVATVNPTDGYIPYRQSATNFADSILKQDLTNTIHFYPPATVNNVGYLFATPNTQVLQLSPSSTNAYRGTASLNAQTNVGSVVLLYTPTNSAQRESITLLVTTNTTRLDFSLGGTNSFHLAPNKLPSDSDSPLYLRTVLQQTNSSPIFAITNGSSLEFSVANSSGYDGTGTHVLTDNGTYQTLGAIGGTNYWKIANGNLTPQDATLPVEVDSSIVFGPGTTNVLARYGNELYYSNSVTATFNLHGGSHVLGLVAANGYNQVGGIQPLNLSGGSTLGSLNLSDSDFSPANGFLPLGYTGRQWGPLTIGGFDDGGGVNWSQLRISHTGTNGAVVFDSQASGIAGLPRNQGFSFNGARAFTISSNSISLQNASTNEIVISTGYNPAITMYPDVGAVATLESPQGFQFNVGASSFTMGAYVLRPTGGDGLSTLGDSSHHFGTAFIDTETPMFIQFQGITKAMKTALTPVEGMVVFQTDNTPGLRVYQSGAWVMVSTVADP